MARKSATIKEGDAIATTMIILEQFLWHAMVAEFHLEIWREKQRARMSSIKNLSLPLPLLLSLDAAMQGLLLNLFYSSLCRYLCRNSKIPKLATAPGNFIWLSTISYQAPALDQPSGVSPTHTIPPTSVNSSRDFHSFFRRRTHTVLHIFDDIPATTPLSGCSTGGPSYSWGR